MVGAYNNAFGEWLRELMAARGITSSRQMRIKTGLSHTTIDDIIHGARPAVGTAIIIASKFHEPITDALRLAGYDDIAAQIEAGNTQSVKEAGQAYEIESGRDNLRRRTQIGQRILSRLLELEMTQTELGRAIGKSQPNISGYIDGRIALDAVDLERIAKALQISVADLYGVDPSDPEDGNTPRLMALYRELPDDAQQELIDIAEAIWKRRRRREKVHGRKAV
jgi:transcriptional regulator with XRE-family HTH domain